MRYGLRIRNKAEEHLVVREKLVSKTDASSFPLFACFSDGKICVS